MLLRARHTGLTVRDLERSIAFYRDVLGLELISTAERSEPAIRAVVGMPDAVIRIAWLRVPGRPEHVVELLQYVAPEGRAVDTRTNNPGTMHRCFTVDDLPATWERLRALGVRARSGPVRLDTGPNAGGYAISLWDPDDITVELLQVPRQER